MISGRRHGQRVAVFGYGACGRGVAANFRAAHAKVSVVDIDPVKRLQAHLDGFDTPHRDLAIASADFIVTVTGGRRVIGPEDIPLFKDGVILANAGHFPVEIDTKAIAAEATSHDLFENAVEELRLADGRALRIVTGGHMVNLAGPRPLGNSIETMDLGFALQARCLEAVALGQIDRTECVVPVPRPINEQVAEAYMKTRYP